MTEAAGRIPAMPFRMGAAVVVFLAAALRAAHAPGGGMDAATGATPLHGQGRAPGGAPVASLRPEAAPSAPAPSALKVLCVSRTRGGREFLGAALASDSVDLVIGGPELIPGNIKDLIQYDCVVLSNIPRSSIGDAKMWMIARYVRDYGGGLVVLGGPGSLGPAYTGTPLGELLPVAMEGGKRFGAAEALPLCLVFLMETSGEMGVGGGGKIAAARAAAEGLVKHLRPEDMLGVISFDDHYRVLAPLGPVGDGGQKTIDLIRRIEPGGGASAGAPLGEALRLLGESKCRVKRVILITGGNTKDLTRYDYRGLVRGYVRAGVSISAFWLGREHGGDFLRALAAGTGGGYCRVEDPSTLPLFVLQDARKTMMESGLISETVVPKPGGKGAILDGIGRGEIPEVAGYIVMSAKPGAEIALYSDVRGDRDPLLAAWRRGRGKAVAWTSDAEGIWAGGAAPAARSAAFWLRLVRWASRERPS